MNQEKLINSIKEYKKEIKSKDFNEKAGINERQERKQYYQSWTKEKLLKMTEDEFVEYIPMTPFPLAFFY